MTISTHLIIAGVGPGKQGLITVDALNAAASADIILVPRSSLHEPGIAERIILHHFPDKKITPLLFPMTDDPQKRDAIILSQLEELRPEFDGRTVFFPVIGDSVLYSTGYYLLRLMPDADCTFIPGISAHSLACSAAKRFLAMSDETLTIIPGTASREKISALLEISDNIAIYKPTAIRDMKSLVDPAKFRTVIRVEHAGNPERERIITGPPALDDVGEYMTVIILQR